MRFWICLIPAAGFRCEKDSSDKRQREVCDYISFDFQKDLYLHLIVTSAYISQIKEGPNMFTLGNTLAVKVSQETMDPSGLFIFFSFEKNSFQNTQLSKNEYTWWLNILVQHNEK